MALRKQQSWDVTFQEAAKIQKRLARSVIQKTAPFLQRRLASPDLLVAGADISFDRGSPMLYAAIVVMRLGDYEIIERVGHRAKSSFPYVPGYLSFREIPPLLTAFERLQSRPDVLLCDGQGRAHPRRFGLASHCGVQFDMPTVGCAKSRLIGSHGEPGRRKGSQCRLCDADEVIGRVVRTRTDVKPLYISVGHKVTLQDAVSLVLRCCPRYRIPEPIRQAHRTVNRMRECLTLR